MPLIELFEDQVELQQSAPAIPPQFAQGTVRGGWFHELDGALDH
jgi:hypothetical protein